jgi:DNA-binding cell septation regulator SpoVG
MYTLNWNSNVREYLDGLKGILVALESHWLASTFSDVDHPVSGRVAAISVRVICGLP